MVGDIAKKENCALILGGGLNGYCTARELAECGVKNIILTDEKKDYAFFSNKLLRTYVQEATADNIYNLILSLQKEFDCVVVYPVSDIFLTALDEACERIEDKRGIIYNPEILHTLFDKSAQYDFCDKNNIAYPKTLSLKEYLSSKTNTLQYPLLVKPNSCDKNNYGKVFKTLVVETESDLEKEKEHLMEYLSSEIDLLITEYIPGGDEDIYGYVGYRTRDGEVLSEWGWRKLSQFPEGSGIFATINNQYPEEIVEIGRRIFHLMNLHGINEIEFKYDATSGTYKYIETNFRTPMLSRLGHLTGVSSCYTQYCDCTGNAVLKRTQEIKKDVHYVLLQAEVVNFIRRPRYLPKLLRNVFKSDKTYFAIFNPRDPVPAFMNIVYTLLDAKQMIQRFM